MITNLVVNARFATRQLSGVDRVAVELTKALLALSGEDLSLTAAGPNADVVTSLPIQIERGKFKGHLWEQIEFPLKNSRDYLLNFCNTGPAFVRRQVVIIHDAQTYLEPGAYSWAFRSWYKLLLPRLARRAELILTISEYSRAKLEHFGVIPPGKARILPNGADHILSIEPDPAALERYGLDGQGYFLAIGNLSPHKNLAMLMRAAADRPAGAPPLIVAGGGNSRVFADAGLTPPPGVRLIGRVSDAELRTLYANAMAFVFPSLTEGFGLPPLEAMLCDCPTIVSNAAAIPEVCGEAAVYVDPHDQAGWTRAMIEIAQSEDRRSALRVAGRQRAAQFTWERSAKLLLKYLDECSG